MAADMALNEFLLARIAEDEAAASAWLDAPRKLAELEAKRLAQDTLFGGAA